MPEFKYKGKTLENKSVSGVMTAASSSQCYAELKKKDIFAYQVKEKNAKIFQSYALKTQELSDFARQIGTMQSSGIPVVRAIDILKERVKKPELLRIYTQLGFFVESGNNLSEAMRSCRGAFPDTMIHLFEAGEANGRLDETAIRTADYYQSERKIKAKIKSAMAYPIILAIITVVITFGLFLFILPQMFAVIEAGGGSITGLTAIIYNASNFMVQQWYVVLLFAVVIGIFIFIFAKQNKRDIHKAKLYIPKIGPLLSIIYTARFARTLCSLYGSGVSMVESVEMSARTVNNLYIQEQFLVAVKKIENGEPLSKAIAEIDGMDKKLVSAIFIGEETGRLETMLTNIATDYEFESETSIDAMLSLIEPVMLIIMGVAVGLVLISVWGPMLEMYNSI